MLQEYWLWCSASQPVVCEELSDGKKCVSKCRSFVPFKFNFKLISKKGEGASVTQLENTFDFLQLM